MLHAHKDIRIRESYNQGATFTITSHPGIMEQQIEQIKNIRIVFIYATLFQLLKSQTQSILNTKKYSGSRVNWTDSKNEAYGGLLNKKFC